MIGKVVKGIAGLFVLMVVFNIFFDRASDTLQKSKSSNADVTAAIPDNKKDIATENKDVYLPSIVLLADMNAALDKVESEYITIKVDTFKIGSSIKEKGEEKNLIGFHQYRFSGWIQGIISSEKLKEFGVEEYDELYDVTIRFKKIKSLSEEIIIELDKSSDVSMFEVLDIYSDKDLKVKDIKLTVLDNKTGIQQIDICESSRDIYRDKDKLSFFMYCADYVGSEEQWSCVKNGVDSFSDFNKAVESCGIIDNSVEKVAICEKIEKRFLSKHSEDENLLRCTEMTAYIENWQCLDSHYNNNENFLTIAEKCGFTDLTI